MVYYLKVNTLNSYTYNNIINWINIVASEEGSKVYLLCDDEEIISALYEAEPAIEKIVNVITSERDEPIFQEIAQKTLADKWFPAGYAHLTTFLHAARNGYDSFWNVDADDTFFAAEIGESKRILRSVERYAKEEKIHAISFDMHVSRTRGTHWSFGITYTDNRIDWFNVMYRYLDEYQDMRKTLEKDTDNLDWYFTFLRNRAKVRLESFYVENLMFAHFRGDLIYRVPPDGIYYWKDGRYVSMIQKYILDKEDEGSMEIPSDLIRIDIGIDHEKSRKYFRAFFNKEDTPAVRMEKDICKNIQPFLSSERTDGKENVKPAVAVGIEELNDKTIILSPYSTVATPLPGFFWEILVRMLNKLGYMVVTYAPDSFVPVKGTRLFVESSYPETIKAVIALYNENVITDQSEKNLHFVIHSDSKSYENAAGYKGTVNLLCDTNDKMIDIAESITDKLTESHS